MPKFAIFVGRKRQNFGEILQNWNISSAIKHARFL
jgi:hypothetical protein